MRFLIVTHGALTAELGASQIAINLGEALRKRGHNVTLWSPLPLPAGTRWWKELQAKRSKLDEFQKSQIPFDVIDCPASFVTRRVRKGANVIARSVQPSIRYQWSDFTRKREKSVRALIRVPFDGAYMLFQLWRFLIGWRRADLIMCLGSLELKWMRRWFPAWRRKLVCYSIAPSEEEQEKLALVRVARARRAPDGLRFLWIGRWVSHKGPDVVAKFINDWCSLNSHGSFTIAGGGTQPENDFPAELIQSKRVLIVPTFDRTELYSLLLDHDVGLFTSKVEGWGLSLNEMLESGMDVFATKAGGTVDLQPFFESLRQFPPTKYLAFEKTLSEVGAEYYETFNWSRIALRYEASIRDALRPNDLLHMPIAGK